MRFLAHLKAFLHDRLFIRQPRVRAFFTKVVYGSADREISLLGKPLVVNSLAENGYVRAHNLSQRCSFWRDEAALVCSLSAILRPGDLFVDIGANVGIYSCVMARLPGVSVMAFEANPSTFERLKVNASRHGVEAFCVPVSDQEHELEFSSGAVSHVFAAAAHRGDYHFGTNIKLKARPLDKLLDTTRPIILKIDVEDHELNVLAGARELFARGAIHGVLVDPSTVTAKVADMLVSLGFTILDPHSFAPVRPVNTPFFALSPERCVAIGVTPSAELKP